MLNNNLQQQIKSLDTKKRKELKKIRKNLTRKTRSFIFKKNL